MSESEIIWNKELGAWEICSTCLEASFDAAYSGGFSPDGDLEEGPSYGSVETLEPDDQYDLFDTSSLYD
jgi:hypothetical protein